jgi:hypothetical protein
MIVLPSTSRCRSKDLITDQRLYFQCKGFGIQSTSIDNYSDTLLCNDIDRLLNAVPGGLLIPWMLLTSPS